ncbi:hypothetical protein HK104_006934 [Borealophlyctis nickersoniae]|nr:hypothetical protein HK104_006934 [Borealophlyctis nickersoniae]
MSLLSRLRVYPLRTQLLVVFGLSVTLSLLIIEILCIAFLIAVSRNIVKTSGDVLMDLSGGSVKDAVDDTRYLFESTLSGAAGSVLMPMSIATGDCFRPDLPYGNATSYFDSAAGVTSARGIIQPSGSRYAGKQISLLHSTFVIANYVGAAPPPSLSPTQQATVDLSVHVDPFFISAFELNPNALSLYVGFASGIFRRFPGTGDQTASSPYDPVNRPWYRDAASHPSSNYTVTEPYRGASTGSWMITLSSRVLNPTNNAFVGVSGIDFAISSLKTLLDSFSTVNSSLTLSIFSLATGAAIAAPSWDLSKWEQDPSTRERPFTYKDMTTPSLSDDVWNRMKNDPLSGEMVIADSGGKGRYLVTWQALRITDGKVVSGSSSWVVVGIASLAEIETPVAEVEKETNATLYRFLGVSVGIFAAILAIVLGLVLVMANATVKPLIRLSKESAKISNNIGNKDLFEGVSNGASLDRDAGEGLRQRLGRIDETESLQRRFYEMVRTIREGSTQPAEIANSNAFYQNTAIPTWNSSAQPSRVVELLPDEPPAFAEIYPIAPAVPGAPAGTGSQVPSGSHAPSAPDIDVIHVGEDGNLHLEVGGDGKE